MRGDKEVSYNGRRTAGIIAIPEERVHRILTHDRPKNRDVTCACVQKWSCMVGVNALTAVWSGTR